MRKHLLLRGLVLSATLLFLSLAQTSAPVSHAQAQETKLEIDLALVLAIDGSNSISDESWALQLSGYASAIDAPEVLRTIAKGRHGTIAVAIVQWADAHCARQIGRWQLVYDKRSAGAMRRTIAEMNRPCAGGTSISAGLRKSMQLLDADALPYRAARRIIDVSGDGSNTGEAYDPVSKVRDVAVRRGIVINGLPIINLHPRLGDPFVVEHYEQHVIGGSGSFLIVAESFDTFAEAVKRKLLREIAVSAR